MSTNQNQQDSNTEQKPVPGQQPKEDTFEPSKKEEQNNDQTAQDKSQDDPADSTVAS